METIKRCFYWIFIGSFFMVSPLYPKDNAPENVSFGPEEKLIFQKSTRDNQYKAPLQITPKRGHCMELQITGMLAQRICEPKELEVEARQLDFFGKLRVEFLNDALTVLNLDSNIRPGIYEKESGSKIMIQTSCEYDLPKVSVGFAGESYKIELDLDGLDLGMHRKFPNLFQHQARYLFGIRRREAKDGQEEIAEFKRIHQFRSFNLDSHRIRENNEQSPRGICRLQLPHSYQKDYQEARLECLDLQRYQNLYVSVPCFPKDLKMP